MTKPTKDHTESELSKYWNKLYSQRKIETLWWLVRLLGKVERTIKGYKYIVSLILVLSFMVQFDYLLNPVREFYQRKNTYQDEEIKKFNELKNIKIIDAHKQRNRTDD